MSLQDIIPIFITSITPVLELRGSMILGWHLGIPWHITIIVSVLGSTLLGILAYLLGDLIIILLQHTIPYYISHLEIKKNNFIKSYEKWGYIALTLFVGIPLPGTGAFTGALVAGLLELQPTKTFLSLFLGNFLAALILSLFFVW